MPQGHKRCANISKGPALWLSPDDHSNTAQANRDDGVCITSHLKLGKEKKKNLTLVLVSVQETNTPTYCRAIWQRPSKPEMHILWDPKTQKLQRTWPVCLWNIMPKHVHDSADYNNYMNWKQVSTNRRITENCSIHRMKFCGTVK